MNRLSLFVILSSFLAGCSGYTGLPNNTPVSPTAIETETYEKNDSIIRLTNGEWPPYTGKNLPEYGCDSEIVVETFAQIGVTVKYGFFPWARGMYLAQTDEWDGTLEWAKTQMALGKFFISAQPISDQAMVFFHRSDRPFSWQSLDDLVGKTIGVTSGYLYSDAFLPAINKLKFEEASSDEANFKKILAGHIDIFPLERNVGMYILNNEFSADERKQITYNEKPLTRFQPYLLLSKANPGNEELIKKYDEAFDQYQKSLRYQELVKNCQQ